VFTLEDIVSKTVDLPSIPSAAIAVMRETDSPTGSAQTVARYIGQDQALAAKVLRLANSAYYGLPRQVTDIPDAVVLLGMRCVKNLCMLAGTYSWLSKPLKGYDLGPAELWRHSFGVAVAAQVVCGQSKKLSPDLGFTAGLLHDLGKVAMSVWLEGKLSALLQLAQRDHLTFDEVERKVLGYDHQDVGGYLGEQWNLPSSLVMAMRYHHRPNETPVQEPVVDAVHVADYLTSAMGLGLGGDALRYEFESDALIRLGLTEDDLEPLADKFLENFESQEKLFEGMSS
jgi:HD-like signal output (HDOD) protein